MDLTFRSVRSLESYFESPEVVAGVDSVLEAHPEIRSLVPTGAAAESVARQVMWGRDVDTAVAAVLASRENAAAMRSLGLGVVAGAVTGGLLGAATAARGVIVPEAESDRAAEAESGGPSPLWLVLAAGACLAAFVALKG